MSDTILEGKVILVAEDDGDLREIIGDVLRLHGASILEAENGARALEIFGANHVDLIVSDVRMPNGDGLDLLAGVRRSADQDMPFLFLSGYCDLSTVEVNRLGAQGLFAKPFDLAALVETIATLMAAAA